MNKNFHIQNNVESKLKILDKDNVNTVNARNVWCDDTYIYTVDYNNASEVYLRSFNHYLEGQNRGVYGYIFME